MIGTRALFPKVLEEGTDLGLGGRAASRNATARPVPAFFTELLIHARGKFKMKKDQRGFNLASKPSGDGCVECLASPKGWWLHLRRCAACGHIGCCDSSPSQHASKHAAATGHPIITSFEPGEDWFFDYEKQGMIKGAKLPPPHAHPESQSTPVPAERVPANWESLLN